MSLQTVHLLFITLSAILAVMVAAWAYDEYVAAGAASYLVTAVGALAAASALTVYGVRFRRKTRFW